MCLIAYVPSGTTVPNRIFNHSASINDDGFGVMSVEGVRKFFGKKALKKCRRYSHELSERGVAHAVHWRYTTHGETSVAMCHPFTLPGGQAHVMHNGVLGGGWSFKATGKESDTALYVAHLTDAPMTADGETDDNPYWGNVAKDIGGGNKFVVMYNDGTFFILNEDAGLWLDGVWYSNDYSLPGYVDYTPGQDEWNYGGTDWRKALAERLKKYDEDDYNHGRPAYGEPPANDTDDGTYVYGKRYNMVTYRWEWPADRKDPEFANWLDRAMAIDADEPAPPLKLAGPSGPTLESDDTLDWEACFLPGDTGGRA